MMQDVLGILDVLIRIEGVVSLFWWFYAQGINLVHFYYSLQLWQPNPTPVWSLYDMMFLSPRDLEVLIMMEGVVWFTI